MTPTEFATWAKDPWWLPTGEIQRSALLRDALNLCAQQHEALEAREESEDHIAECERCMGEVGVPQQPYCIQGQQFASKAFIFQQEALEAAKAFKEKYSHDTD